MERAYRGSAALLVSALVGRNDLSKLDINDLYTVLRWAKEDTK